MESQFKSVKINFDKKNDTRVATPDKRDIPLTTFINYLLHTYPRLDHYIKKLPFSDLIEEDILTCWLK